MVDKTIVSAHLLTASMKPTEKNPVRIELNILNRVTSDGLGRDIILKC